MATATATTTTGETLKAQKIALSLIKADKKALQPRMEMDEEHQARMAQAYIDGDDIPPPVHLFFDGKFYWLVDGFHRYFAMWSLRHMGAKFQHIRAFVHHGTKDEAIAYAAVANLDNRSKPMSNEDRKKAMWMLMDLVDWNGGEIGPSANSLGKKVIISNTSAATYWTEYFPARGMAIPEKSIKSDGRIQPTSRRTKQNQRTPAVNKNSSNGHYSMKIDGRKFHLGKDPGNLEEKINRLIESRESDVNKYKKFNNLFKSFIFAVKVVPMPIYNQGNVYGLYARSINGIAVTWEPFRDKTTATAAFGRAMHAKLTIGATRAVILCPVEDGPRDVMDDYSRAYGVEWMTIEDFIESLKGEPGP